MSTTIEATKLLDRSNIAEWPNPKPITTERVTVRISQGEGRTEQHSQIESGFIRNAKLSPDALLGRW
jgi:hypothetical protein